ncbi:MAG: hypothetical protein IPI67_04380 [Myxococcales bacterium]|nr:hypothetical protein [Myxococcales bacterium]
MKCAWLAPLVLVIGCTRAPAPTAHDGAPDPAPASTGAPAPTAPAEGTASEPNSEAPQAATEGSSELPGALNASSSKVAGCLASPGGTEQAPRSRGMAAQKPELAVAPVSGGVQVVHELSHACCLKSKIDSKVEGNVVTLNEVLSGTPCRCMCSSTVTTSVRLAPGNYTVKVLVDTNGQKHASGEQQVTVK